MVEINKKDNSIEMTQGDSLKIKIILRKKNGILYVPEQEDSIRFALSTVHKGELGYKLLLRKEIPLNTLELNLVPEETKNIPSNHIYKYDIQITHTDGTTDTFISGLFVLKGEVE